MFKKELSNQLLRILGERNLTVTDAAELSHVTRNYFTNLIKGEQTASITVLENLCSAFEVNPDELLVNSKSKTPDKSKPMQIKQVFCQDQFPHSIHKPICPNCEKLLERDNQAYCDKCGQRLSWSNYKHAELVSKLPEGRGEQDEKILRRDRINSGR